MVVENAGFGAVDCTTFVDPWSGPGGAELDGPGFDAGDCTTSVDPWSGPGGAELDDACASDDSAGLSHDSKYFASSFSKSSFPRLPNTVIVSLGICTTSTNA